MAAYSVCLPLHLVTALCDYTTPGGSGDSFSLLLGAYGDALQHRDLPLADSCSFQNWFWHSFSFCVYFVSSFFKQCLLLSFESSPTIITFVVLFLSRISGSSWSRGFPPALFQCLLLLVIRVSTLESKLLLTSNVAHSCS